MFKAGTTEMGWPVIECNIGENIGKNLSLFTMASVMVNITMIGVIDSPCITLIRHPCLGLCRSQLTIKQGNRISSAKAYLNPVKRRVNLDIQTEAKVVKVGSFY